MVNYSIKVYGRVKNQNNSTKTVLYDIVNRKEEKLDELVIYNNFVQQGSNTCSFRFHKVFKEKSSQEDVFEIVAKPVISSALEGFNGTVFAYGQTGSGKTYSITGSPKNYNDRGIIPRSIQYIFAQNEKITAKPTIYISYMEIYNEIGYDLLSSRQDNTAKSLEELPRIVLLEDGNGELHMRNLSVLPVSTEQEAMRLLFLGDTNRTIAETPMNEYSSRSHCIFTIYITSRDESSNILRYSKLHLVDLAGSERVCKSLTTGNALREAKHINLSLHYLQQVILALSESNRFHVPYRNSMMTYILKDSLSGNCLTTMLATLALNKDNIQETISTCRFAQRVSMISTAPMINEMKDPQREITFLRNKIEELHRHIATLTGISSHALLDKNQQLQYTKEVEKYLVSTEQELLVQPCMNHIQFCFKLLKSKINSQNLADKEMQLKCVESEKKLTNLTDCLYKKNEEINKLRKIIDDIPENPINPNSRLPISKLNTNVIVNYLTEQDHTGKDRYEKNVSKFDSKIDKSEKELFEAFLKSSNVSNDLYYYTQNLQKKLETAKLYADTIDQCQKNITYIREKLQARSDNVVKNKLVTELKEQQSVYTKSLDALKTVKNETYHLQSGLKKAEITAMKSFNSWLETQHGNLNGSNSKDSACSTASSKSVLLCKDCSCTADIDKVPVMCYNPTLQLPVGCWTNYWNGNLCMGPVCQPIVIDNNQCCNYPRVGTLPCQSVASNNRVQVGELSRKQSQNCSLCCDTSTIGDVCSKRKDSVVLNVVEYSDCSVADKCLYATDESSCCNFHQAPSTKCLYSHVTDSCIRQDQCYNEIQRMRCIEEPTRPDLLKDTDTAEFKEFMKTVSLTGDMEIDQEIFNFYRNKFCS